MSVRRIPALLVLVLAVAATGCKPQQPSSDGPRRRGEATKGAKDPSAEAVVRELLKARLTEVELKRHLEVVRGLNEIQGMDHESTTVQRTPTVTTYLQSRGLTFESFKRTHAKVNMAILAMWKRDTVAKEKVDAVPTFRALLHEIIAAEANVPNENVELVRKYRADLEACGMMKRTPQLQEGRRPE